MTLPPPDSTLSYHGSTPRISRLAIIALVVAILAALTFFLIIPPMIAFILALIANNRITKNPAKLAGKGYTVAALTLSLCTSCAAMFFALLVPSFGSRELPHRAACAANLRGIVSAMIIYSAQNNDQFPVVTYAPYSPALNSPTATAIGANTDDVVKSYYKAPFPQAGSVTASLWIMTLQGMAPKLFLCKYDRAVTGSAAPTDAKGNYFNNFQSDGQISYSAAYPWKADGTVGKWWINTSDASLPLMADMAPEQGTGKPRRNLTPAAAPTNYKSWNSGNHQGDGQNIAFADAHVDYDKNPCVGQNNDNIWTTSAIPSTAPAQFGGIPATKSSPGLTSDASPFDIILFPIRNLDTGRL